MSALSLGCSGEDGTNGTAGPGGEAGERGAEGQNGENGTNGTNGDPGVPGAPGTSGEDGESGSSGSGVAGLRLDLLGRYSTGIFDAGAVEIVDFHAASARAYFVNANAGTVQIVDLGDPSAPSLDTAAGNAGQLDLAADLVADGLAGDVAEVGDANSVAIFGDTLAVCLSASPSTNDGFVALYTLSAAGDPTYASGVQVGALPDMITFTPDGSTLLVANEGEPSSDYSIDPLGSVSIIDVSGGATIEQSDVDTLDFTDFNAAGPRAAELPPGVRIFGVKAGAIPSTVAEDIEPEFVTVSPDGATAWVSLQENNALAIIDIAGRAIDSIVALGLKDFSVPGNQFDASNEDHGVNIRNWPVFGMYLPDGLASFEVGGQTYVVSANEGDSRVYEDAFSEEIRIKGLREDNDVLMDIDNPTFGGFPNPFDEGDLSNLDADANLGRLLISAAQGGTNCVLGVDGEDATLADDGGECAWNVFHSFGARSFSIWSASGNQVFDSGNQFESLLASRFGSGFNVSNTDSQGDGRSDDKGPEPEGVVVGSIEGRIYAFIGLERMGGIMVYDVTNPEAPSFVSYRLDRDLSVTDPESELEAAGDLGPEGLKLVAATDSPTGTPLLLVGNEVSGTLAVYEVRTLPSE